MYYGYDAFLGDIVALKQKIEKKFVPDALICVTRGGMTMTHFLGLAWNLRTVYSINAISYSDKKVQSDIIIENIPALKNTDKNVLLVDEIVDSGKSLSAVLQTLQTRFPAHKFFSCAIFQKPDASAMADFYLKDPKEWIDFFWEVDVLNACKNP